MRKILTFCAFVCAACCALASGKSVAKVDDSMVFPDLIIDCTFEAWGKYHLIDYALMQHADVDWLTNYEFPAPEGPVSIRQINFERSRVVPVQTMMIGNQLIDSPMWQFTYQSLASGVQLMCGDPRNLTDEQKTWYI